MVDNSDEPRVPTIDAVHHDIDTANSYRMEYIKTLLLLAGGLFAFSVTFHPTITTPIVYTSLFWYSWIGLAISMFGGFVQLAGWERFYSSYQRYEHRKLDGKPRRKRLTAFRRMGLIAQTFGFAIGVCALGAFTALNLK